MNLEEKHLLDELKDKVQELSENMNKFNIAEHIELIRSPKHMIFINFIAGLARGLGVAVGATILGALFLMFLFRLAELNLPGIGFFIAKIVKIVQTYL